MGKKFKPLNGVVTTDSDESPDRKEVMSLVEKCDGYILLVKMGSNLSIRADGMDREEAISSVAQLSARMLHDFQG